MRFEADEVTLVGGIRHGRTLGSPVAIEIANTEWPKWETEMSPGPGPALQGADPAPARSRRPLRACSSTGSTTPATCSSGPRPGRRPPGWRPGTLAKLLLAQIGVDVLSHIVQLGPERAEPGALPTVDDLPRIDESQVRCADPEAEARMVAAVKAAAKDGDSLGRGGRGDRLRRAGRASGATCTGTGGSTPCWPRR